MVIMSRFIKYLLQTKDYTHVCGNHKEIIFILRLKLRLIYTNEQTVWFFHTYLRIKELKKINPYPEFKTTSEKKGRKYLY